MQLHKIPLFQQLEKSQNILIAGAGGGFDFYAGLPLYFSLIEQGKTVTLANFSFTWLGETTAKEVFPFCYEIQNTDRDLSGRNYFPEKYLKSWMELQKKSVDIYAFERTGVNPLKDAYKFLIKKHQLDTIILIDGGTDSLMFGDEESLGTPQEDACSMAAVYRSGVKNQFLVSIGFGIDAFHGVSHFRFLENVATIDKSGGYLGVFQLLNNMKEAVYYRDAVYYANKVMAGKESIVSNSVVSALENNFGNYHKTRRTRGSQLFINPLMTIYWNFDLRKVMNHIKYYHLIRNTNTLGELNFELSKYRNNLESLRKNEKLSI